MRFITLYLLLLSSVQGIFAQSKFALDQPDGSTGKKGRFYFLWGYNRDWYARTNIHFRNRDGDPAQFNQKGIYDFSIYKVKAHDRPNFEQMLDVVNITIPQYNFRIGYFFNNKHGLELNFDHAKYVVDDWQTVRIKGHIFGEPVDKDTVLDPGFLHFEHSDGANFWMMNYVRRFGLYNSSKHWLGVIAKGGGGIVYPRTDVTLFGSRINNNWHVSGYCLGLETGLRAELFKNMVIEFTGKGVFANYFVCLVQGKGRGQASHLMWAGELLLNVGYTF